MKRLIIVLFLFFAIGYIFSVEILVIGTRNNTRTFTITTVDALYDIEAFKLNLIPNGFYQGSALFLNSPGLSSTHTTIMLNSVVLNDPTTGNLDLSLFPDYLFDSIRYYRFDTSSIIGGEGIGGNLKIDHNIKMQLNSYLYIDTNQRDICTTIPVKGKELKINLMFQEKSGDCGRKNSDFKKNNLGLNMQFKGLLNFLLNYTDEDLGTPGPVPADGSYDDALYPDNRQTGKYFWFILSGLGKKLNGNIFYKNSKITYLSEYFGTYYTSNIDYELISASNLYRTIFGNYLRFTEKFSICYTKYNEKNVKKEEFSLGAAYLPIGIGGNLKLNSSSFNDIFFSGNLFFERKFGTGDVLIYLSRGLKEPSLNDLYWEMGGNENLKNEEATSLFLKYKINKFSLSYNYKNIKNMIVWILKDPSTYYYQAENINKAQINSISLNYELKYNFVTIYDKISANWGDQERYYKTDTDINGNTIYETKKFPATYLPDLVNTLSVQIQIKKWKIKMDYLYRGLEKNIYFNDQLKKLLPIHKADILFQYDIKRLKTSFGIKNLFGSKGKINFGNSPSDEDYPLARRKFFVKIGIE